MHYARARRGQQLDDPIRERQARACVIEQCDRPTIARSMCGMHYRRWNLYGDPLAGGPFVEDLPDPRRCSVEGCSRGHYGGGFCGPHLRRFQIHGDPLAGKGSKSLGLPSVSKPCEADDCDADAKANGLCWTHLNRQRYADPDYKTEWGRWARERRARKRGATVEPFTKEQVFERDRWRCQLCGKPTNRSVSWPHPDFPVLDHIVPLALGGAHSLANTQCSHNRCNAAKGVGGSGQLRLLG